MGLKVVENAGTWDIRCILNIDPMGHHVIQTSKRG